MPLWQSCDCTVTVQVYKVGARRFDVRAGTRLGKWRLSHPEAIVKECSAVSRIVDGITPEEPEAQPISFVVRIWKQTGTADRECRGWVEHVQSGQRTFFLGLDQLPRAIARYIGVSNRRGGGWQNRLMCWRARVAGWFARGEEE